MKVDGSVCLRCGACAGVCPFDAVEVSNGSVQPNERCTDCGICEKICPVGAVEVERKI